MVERKRRRSSMLNLPKVPIMLNLPKLAVIAVQASVGVALGASWAVTALAETAPPNPVTQSQTTPLLRGGDLVRLRSAGPALTVKSVNGTGSSALGGRRGSACFGLPPSLLP